MLANLLPGIRDLRTPLATGYIWLLTFWLWIPEHFKDVPPSTGVPGDIARLAHYSGRVGIAIALSFVAYLIGALSELFSSPLTQLGSFVSWYTFIERNMRLERQLKRNRQRWRYRRGRQSRDVWDAEPEAETSLRKRLLARWLAFWYGERNATIIVEGVRVKILRRDFWRYSASGINDDAGYWSKVALVNARYGSGGLYGLREAAQRIKPDLYSSSQRSRDRLSRDKGKALFSYLVQEVYKLGNSLLGKEPELFSTYDRLIAEYEFRIGVTAPLIALILTLTVRWSLLWLLALLPLLLLLKTGSERRAEAGNLLAEAARQGRLPISLPPELSGSIEDDEED